MLYLLPQNFFKPLVIQKTFCALLSIGALAKNSFRSALVKEKTRWPPYPVAAKFDQNWMMLIARLASVLEKPSLVEAVNLEEDLSTSEVEDSLSRKSGYPKT